LFEDDPQAGAFSLNGKMIDRPHLIQARRMLARAPTLKET
jgi:citrate lyase subunit beta/citryl-CoA lyase